jgi:hypothetical protein
MAVRVRAVLNDVIGHETAIKAIIGVPQGRPASLGHFGVAPESGVLLPGGVQFEFHRNVDLPRLLQLSERVLEKLTDYETKKGLINAAEAQSWAAERQVADYLAEAREAVVTVFDHCLQLGVPGGFLGVTMNAQRLQDNKELRVHEAFRAIDTLDQAYGALVGEVAYSTPPPPFMMGAPAAVRAPANNNRGAGRPANRAPAAGPVARGVQCGYYRRDAAGQMRGPIPRFYNGEDAPANVRRAAPAAGRGPRGDQWVMGSDGRGNHYRYRVQG